MDKFLRLTALFSCLGMLVLGTAALDPNGPLLSSFLGCSAGKMTWAEIIEIIGEGERFARFKEVSLHRLETKRHIAEEVIARRQSLAEAMQQFRALDREWPYFDFNPTRALRGMSEDEWHGRGVLIMVGLVLVHRPDEADAAVARLEKELQELLADRQKRPAAPVEKPSERSR